MTDFFQERGPGHGQRYGSAGPVEERCAEFLLEIANLAAERRLSDVQSGRGAAEMQLLSDGGRSFW